MLVRKTLSVSAVEGRDPWISSSTYVLFSGCHSSFLRVFCQKRQEDSGPVNWNQVKKKVVGEGNYLVVTSSKTGEVLIV